MMRRLMLLVLAVGCADADRAERADPMDSAGEDEAPQIEIDEDQIMLDGRDYAEQLVRMTSEPEDSETHSDAAAVHVWGIEDAVTKFMSINPDDPTQSISFDEGTMLVKEHLDEAGATVGLTIMYKGPPGYNPDARDWFWARTRGEDVTDRGRVQWCMDCHAAAHNTDLVVGFRKSQ